MVFYFNCDENPDWIIYMGADKYENEDLIKYGWEEDVWFHVDNISSAHVYLRMLDGSTISDIPGPVMGACCQLVKANSIQGCKLTDINVVITPWSNLKKTGDMQTGQVGFYNDKLVKRVHVKKTVKKIVKAIESSRREEFPDLATMREDHDREKRLSAKHDGIKRRQEEKKAIEAARAEKNAAKARALERLEHAASLEANNVYSEGRGDDDFLAGGDGDVESEEEEEVDPTMADFM